MLTPVPCDRTRPPCTAFCEQLLETAGARFAGPIAILRNWTFCLFYVMAELWGSVVVSVLFWGFANQITTVEEASQFYPLFGLGANVALIFSGQAVKYFSMVSGGGAGVHGVVLWTCVGAHAAAALNNLRVLRHCG
jgi:ATP/ADP translocase